VADSEVGGQIEALVAEDEDGAEKKSGHERSPLDGISKNIVQTAREKAAGSSAIGRGRNAVRRRDKGKGEGGFFIDDHSVLFYLFIYFAFLLRSFIPKGYVDHLHQGKARHVLRQRKSSGALCASLEVCMGPS